MKLGFKKQQATLGLDIGSKSTKLVRLAFNGTAKPDLDLCDSIETGYDDESFDGNLRTYIKDMKLTGLSTALSIEDNSLKIRKMDLPKMPDADLIEAIKWNIRDSIEGEIDDITVKFFQLSKADITDEAKIEVVAYAINRNAVNATIERVQGLGLDPFFVEPKPVTLASCLERCYGSDSQFLAGVDIGHSHTLFYVIGDGTFLFSRPLLGINLQLKKSEKDSFNQKLAIEIQKSIDTFKVNFKMQDINEIYLSGGGALNSELKDYLTKNMGIKAENLNPFLSVNKNEAMKGLKPALFAQAVSLAFLQL